MAKESDSKLYAFLGVFLGIIGFVIVMLTRKTDKYAMYYAKQGLVITIAWAIVYILGLFIPVLGWFIIFPLGSIAVLILWIIAIINSLSGKEKPTPIIGKFVEKFKF